VPIPLPDPPARAIPPEGLSIYLTGIGGTGVVTVSQVIATAALADGLRVVGMDQTGLSQKGGPVVSHVKLLSAGSGHQAAAAVGLGQADAYVACDLLVGSDDRHLVRASPRRSLAIVSTSQVPTAQMVTDVRTAFPDGERLADRVRAATRRDGSVYLDAAAVAEGLLGDAQVANVVLLGAAYQVGAIPVSAESLEAAIRANGVSVAANLAAFRWGRYAAIDPLAVERASTRRRVGAAPLQPSPAARRLVAGWLANRWLPAGTRAVAEIRAAELVDYQDRGYARTYLAFVQRVTARERDAAPGRTALSEAVARWLFKLMAYKDEYEVARLHLEDQFHTGVRTEFPAGTLRFHLHPPLLRALGLTRKLALGPGTATLFRALRGLTRLRGTPLDPFGHAEVRRVERALIGQYRAAIEEALATLSPASYDRAVALAQLPDLVRGYEQIKLANVARYRAELQLRRSQIASARAAAPAAGAVRVVTLPPLTITRTS
jgi:indolepyruvate ferredoxin oxidoreductase